MYLSHVYYVLLFLILYMHWFNLVCETNKTIKLLKTINKITLGLCEYSIISGLEGFIRKLKIFCKLGDFLIEKIFFILKTINYFEILFFS